ncbi:hypothetical protein OC834_002289 [Tilletia horrida]|nr:hypothetical protein OC834_002289 [Tilletia horrida]
MPPPLPPSSPTGAGAHHVLNMPTVVVDPYLADITVPFLAVSLALMLNGCIYSLAALYAAKTGKKDSWVLKMAVAVTVLCNTVTFSFRLYRAHAFVAKDTISNLRTGVKWDYVGHMLTLAPVRSITQIYISRRAWILHQHRSPDSSNSNSNSSSIGIGGAVRRLSSNSKSNGASGKWAARRTRAIKWVGLGLLSAEGLLGLALPLVMMLTGQEEGAYVSPFAADVVKVLFVAYDALNVVLQAGVSYLFASALKRMDAALRASRQAVSLLTRMQLVTSLCFCVLSTLSVFTFLNFHLPTGGLTDLYVLTLGLMEDSFGIAFLLALLVRESVREAMAARGEVDVLSPEAGQLVFFEEEEEAHLGLGTGPGPGAGGKAAGAHGRARSLPSLGGDWIPSWSLKASNKAAAADNGPRAPPPSAGADQQRRRESSGPGATFAAIRLIGRRRSSGASSAQTRVAR